VKKLAECLGLLGLIGGLVILAVSDTNFGKKLDAVGFGTITLAVATAVLAYFTWAAVREAEADRRLAEEALAESRRQAEAATAALELSRRQADISQRILNGELRPILVPVPHWVAEMEEFQYPDYSKKTRLPLGAAQFLLDHTDQILISVPLRNIGRGVAFIDTMYVATGQGHLHATGSTNLHPAPGDTTRALWRIQPADESHAPLKALIATMSDAVVTVVYRDIAGQQRTFTDVTYRPSRLPEVYEPHQTVLSEPDAERDIPNGAVLRTSG
jgi:lysylphosphatidylglycerol synthetase-like protein (DUF2156 family)